jgi:hypothetical protein
MKSRHLTAEETSRHALDSMIWECLVSGMAAFSASPRSPDEGKQASPMAHTEGKTPRRARWNKAGPALVFPLIPAIRRVGRTS